MRHREKDVVKMQLITIVAVAASMLVGASAQAQSKSSYPSEIQKDLDEARKECAAADNGKAQVNPGFVRELDLAGNKGADYAVDSANSNARHLNWSIAAQAAACTTSMSRPSAATCAASSPEMSASTRSARRQARKRSCSICMAAFAAKPAQRIACRKSRSPKNPSNSRIARPFKPSSCLQASSAA